MKITNDTTTNQIAELMGSDATERQGRIMLGLMAREGIVDTEEVSEKAWLKLLDDVLTIEAAEFDSDESTDSDK